MTCVTYLWLGKHGYSRFALDYSLLAFGSRFVLILNSTDGPSSNEVSSRAERSEVEGPAVVSWRQDANIWYTTNVPTQQRPSAAQGESPVLQDGETGEIGSRVP